MKNTINYVVIILSIIILSTLAYFLSGYLVSLYFNHQIHASRAAISKQIDIQDNLSSDILVTFLNYETAVDEFEENSSKVNLAIFLMTQQKLNHLLFKASNTYGLGVKRWIDRFDVWQYQFNNKLVTQSDRSKDFVLTARVGILFYESKINNIISKAEEKYKLNTYNDLLYAPYHGKTPRSLKNKIEAIYKNKAKALMPKAVESFKWSTKYNSMTACMGPVSDKLTPENIAANITFIQYRTRFCPSSATTSKSESLCYQVKHSSIAQKQARVYCDIAERREVEPANHSKKQYGKLSFAAYFKKYVEPLVPSHKKKLMSHVNSGNYNQLYDTCALNMQPVVSYRDPQVDVRTAAYVMYGNTICQKFFNHSDDGFKYSGMFTDFPAHKLNSKEKSSIKRGKVSGK